MKTRTLTNSLGALAIAASIFAAAVGNAALINIVAPDNIINTATSYTPAGGQWNRPMSNLYDGKIGETYNGADESTHVIFRLDTDPSPVTYFFASNYSLSKLSAYVNTTRWTGSFNFDRETDQVTFEVSTDGGSNWTLAGTVADTAFTVAPENGSWAIAAVSGLWTGVDTIRYSFSPVATGTQPRVGEVTAIQAILEFEQFSGSGSWWGTGNWNGSTWANPGVANFNAPGSISIDQDGTTNPEVRGMNFNTAGTYNLTPGGGTLNLGGDIDMGGATVNISAPMTLDTNVGVSGGGTLSIDGTVTNTGNTLTVTGTTLVVDSPLAGTGSIVGGTVDLQGGATLKGTGTLGNVIVTNGTIAPGNSIGTINETSLTYLAGSDYEWEFSNTTADLISVTGALTLPASPGQIDLIIIPLGANAVDLLDSFALFNYGTLADGDGALDDTGGIDITTYFNITRLGTKWLSDIGDITITADGGVISIQGLTYVPEPSTAILAGLGLMGVCFRRRRRK